MYRWTCIGARSVCESRVFQNIGARGVYEGLVFQNAATRSKSKHGVFSDRTFLEWTFKVGVLKQLPNVCFVLCAPAIPDFINRIDEVSRWRAWHFRTLCFLQ